MENRNSAGTALRSIDGEDVTTWALPEGAITRLGRGGIRDMAFSPDEQYLAVASAIGLWLYQLPTLFPIALWDTERGMTNSVTFSPDNRRIVTHTCAGDLKIWDFERGICIAEVDDHGSSNILKPVFSQDGQRIASIIVTLRIKETFFVFCNRMRLL